MQEERYGGRAGRVGLSDVTEHGPDRRASLATEASLHVPAALPPARPGGRVQCGCSTAAESSSTAAQQLLCRPHIPPPGM